MLVVGGTVWPLLWQWCIGAGVVVLKETAASVRTVLADMFQLRPLSYLTQCSLVSEKNAVKPADKGEDKPLPNKGQTSQQRTNPV